MAYFWFVRFVAFFHVLRLARHAMSAPIIESYKPRLSRERKTTGVKEWEELNKMVKSLEHKIDEAEVRQKIMEAQMKFPLAFMGRSNRMQAALRNYYYGIPSTIYINTTIVNMAGVHLQIFEDGTVNGTNDYKSPYAQLTVESVGSYGLIRIKGMLSQKYLVYKETGRAVAETQDGFNHSQIFDSIFRQKMGKELFYMAIQNLKYKWYLGFRRNGENRRILKKGPRVRFRHKESRFYLNLGPRLGR